MQALKFICRNYNKKKGGTFTKLTVKGKYTPFAVLENEETYQIRFTKDSQASEPTKDGIYSVAYDKGGVWVDDRNENLIIRVRAVNCKFQESLPVFKDNTEE